VPYALGPSLAVETADPGIVSEVAAPRSRLSFRVADAAHFALIPSSSSVNPYII
jgi:hypothetical protein